MLVVRKTDICSAVKLALKNRNLPVSKWDTVLPDAQLCIHFSLCTATNETPHERFLKFSCHSLLC